MERLKQMKEMLTSCVEGQMTNLERVDTEEFAKVIDSIKDLSEALYYCTITKAMEENTNEDNSHYMDKYLPETSTHYRDMDRQSGKMYYTPYYPEMMPPYYPPMYYTENNVGRNSNGQFTSRSGSSSSNQGGRRGDSEYEGYDREYPKEIRDHREGTSPIMRRFYMEAKENHHDKKAQMQELEKYMQELSKDITEMIGDASPEETSLLKQRLTTLIEKIK